MWLFLMSVFFVGQVHPEPDSNVLKLPQCPQYGSQKWTEIENMFCQIPGEQLHCQEHYNNERLQITSICATPSNCGAEQKSSTTTLTSNHHVNDSIALGLGIPLAVVLIIVFVVIAICRKTCFQVLCSAKQRLWKSCPEDNFEKVEYDKCPVDTHDLEAKQEQNIYLTLFSVHKASPNTSSTESANIQETWVDGENEVSSLKPAIPVNIETFSKEDGKCEGLSRGILISTPDSDDNPQCVPSPSEDNTYLWESMSQHSSNEGTAKEAAPYFVQCSEISTETDVKHKVDKNPETVSKRQERNIKNQDEEGSQVIDTSLELVECNKICAESGMKQTMDKNSETVFKSEDHNTKERDEKRNDVKVSTDQANTHQLVQCSETGTENGMKHKVDSTLDRVIEKKDPNAREEDKGGSGVKDTEPQLAQCSNTVAESLMKHKIDKNSETMTKTKDHIARQQDEGGGHVKFKDKS